jgi:2-keto-4-pentenoate hydratase/2-oxohepta-3-ene-1,7-dioic acid hydratase in catechol pathway
MQIIRFMSQGGNIFTGCEYDGQTATIIDGDIFTDFQISKVKKQVKRLLTPIAPTVIYGIGLNYKPHIEETGLGFPEYPVVFMKNLGAAAAHLDDIIIPTSCQSPPQVDYEAELCVVIKKKTKNISVDDALDSVLGYTCANDITARGWQMNGGGKQWNKGKSFDTFCPFGPGIVTPDELSDPGNLEVECILNGKTMQKGNTREMLFSVAQLISFLSESATLLPGTLILTGTPSGVGFTREPPVFLEDKDVLETRIEGIGVLKNLVILENI